jgi:transposase InsO family protein
MLDIASNEQVNALRAQLKNKHLFIEVINAIMAQDSMRIVWDQWRARHRASQYVLEEGKLWKLHRGTSMRARTRTKCISHAEAEQQAAQQHQQGGHMGRDEVKIALTDAISGPDLDLSIIKAIQACTQCKNFGPSQLNALLQLIMWWHPFELLVGDYLLMPPGKGGYHTVGLYLDTFSQHVWAFKHKTADTAKTTVDVLSTISKVFIAPKTFMMDRGSHFNNLAEWEFCDANGCKHHIMPVYSLWVNGLVEGTNKILLHMLKWLCALEVGETKGKDGWEKLPKSWPNYLDEVIKALNHQILPMQKFSPKELLLGIVINIPKSELEQATMEPSMEVAAIHMAYMAQQWLDRYKATVKHAIAWKWAFDKQVLKSSGEVTFKKG